MCKARGAFGALLLRPCAMAIFGGLAITLGLGSSLALGPYDDPQTAEGWAWPQIERSEMADFNERCGTPALLADAVGGKQLLSRTSLNS